LVQSAWHGNAQDTIQHQSGYYAQLRHWLTEETGYQWIQGTKPQTLAYALTDSTRRACGMDRGKIPRLERLRRRLRAPIL
jgi:hypothetical protein